MYISQIRYQFCWFQQKLKSGKVTFFFKSTYFWSSCSQMFFKGGVLKSYAIFTGKHLRWSPFLIKFQSFRPATLKVTPMKVFYCDYCKIFKNSFFHRTPPLAASVTCERRSYFKIWHDYFYLKICLWILADWLFSCAQKTREGIFLISTRAKFLASALLILKNTEIFNSFCADKRCITITVY